MNSDIDQTAFSEEDAAPTQEIKQIEINLNVIKSFFTNTVALYECLIKKCCKSCNVVRSEDFITLHKTLCDFESIFKVFEVSFNNNLLNSFVKIQNNEDTQKFPCYINSCNLSYSTEEGAKIHFIKNHCKKGNMFNIVTDNTDSLLDFSQIKRDDEGRFICQNDGCTYASNDRSNFRVHTKRHSGDRKFVCICSKKFFTRDPLMIHFVRVHLKDVNWDLANKDIRSLRKTVRRLINRNYCLFNSNDDIPDSDSDLNGPSNEENSTLSHLITQAISTSASDENTDLPNEDIENNKNLGLNPEMEDIEIVDGSVDIKGAIDETNMDDGGDVDEDAEPMNSFNVSINLKDNNFFTDSVTFKSEGISDDIDDLLTKNNPNESINATMSLPSTKVIKKDIPQRARKYKCPHKFCSQEFFTTKNLLIHLKASHDPNNPIPCQESGCSARFKSAALLAQHQKRHRVQYTCSLCSYKTHLAALMTRHNRQHAGDQLFHECSICHEKFEYLGSLSSHRRKVHNEDEPLICDWKDCDKKFKTIIGLKKHRREFHLNMKAEIRCEWPECNAVFSNRTAMTNHMRIHTNERPYQCTWQDCGKWFRLKETLKRHIKLHQGYKPHSCPFDNCNSSFFTKRNVKMHIEKVHLKNPSTKSKIKMEIDEETEEV